MDGGYFSLFLFSFGYFIQLRASRVLYERSAFTYIKLIEQASSDDQPAIMIQEGSDDEVQGSLYKLT